MPLSHEPWLVALSVALAVQGAFVGLSLAAQIGDAAGRRRRVLLAGAAVSLALAIWTMHFVGMLAARVPFPVDYLAVPTLLSFLVAVIVVGIALLAVSTGPPTRTRLAASAIFMGLGIVSMHYIGMMALHASAHMEHAPAFVAASVAVAIAASGLALWLAAGSGRRHSPAASATVLGIAISGMHYTAMAGLTLYPHGQPATSAPALSTDLLAIIVALVAFLVSGGCLLLLVPDRAARRPGAEVIPPAATITPETGEPPAAPAMVMHAAPATSPARHLPVERDGLTHLLPVDEIVAVQANAHYTHVFDGTSRLFCQLAIGEVEARLDPSRFVRVHRSHIINIERVAGSRLGGDHATIAMAGREPYRVPVSRARMAEIRHRLAPEQARGFSPATQAISQQH